MFRLFITSRPELAIRLGFKQISSDLYQDVVLHEVTKATIELDITTYLQFELAKIRDDHNLLQGKEDILSSDWPSKKEIESLVNLSVPFFISAATACRFIGDSRFDPKARLATVLASRCESQINQLDAIYLPILNQMLIGLTPQEKEDILKDFRTIVGTIVLSLAPLSVNALGPLLHMPTHLIERRLDLLHSIISIPRGRDSPVRILHQSLSDFLLDHKRSGEFWIEKHVVHGFLVAKCLEVLTATPHLRMDICDAREPGILRRDISAQSINDSLPACLQYTCCYWVNHLEQCDDPANQEKMVFRFLEERFIFWLEALSLLGRVMESYRLLTILKSH